MMYVLIIFALNGHGGVATAEFNGEAKCLAAKAQVEKIRTPGNLLYNALCVERGR
jgi:hypothetical protein